jgi:hypothetical protein
MKLYYIIFHKQYGGDSEVAEKIRLRDEWAEGAKITNRGNNLDYTTVICTADDIAYFAESGISFDIQKSAATAGLASAVEKIKENARNIGGNSSNVVNRSDYFNEKVEVHVPGLALMTYNDIMLCEDTCTDLLQSHLDKGWRIIAVSPQPDQRRPDYILGRYNPDKEPNNYAKRNVDSDR